MIRQCGATVNRLSWCCSQEFIINLVTSNETELFHKTKHNFVIKLIAYLLGFFSETNLMSLIIND
jgi:hypothetical protein